MNKTRIRKLKKALELINTAATIVQEVSDEETEAYDNCSEYFPDAERTERLEESSSALEEVNDFISSAECELESFIDTYS